MERDNSPHIQAQSISVGGYSADGSGTVRMVQTPFPSWCKSRLFQLSPEGLAIFSGNDLLFPSFGGTSAFSRTLQRCPNRFGVNHAQSPLRNRSKDRSVDTFAAVSIWKRKETVKTIRNGIKPFLFPNTPRSATSSGVWNHSRKWATIFIRPSRGEIVALLSGQCSLEESSGSSVL